MTAARAKIRPVLPGFACAALIACSQPPRPAPPTAPATASCALSDLKVADVNGILTAPITSSKPVSGDAQSCEFLTAGFAAVTVSIRPGLGRSTLEAWMTGKMPLKGSPIAGVGDAAVWQDTLHELVAQKSGLLCDIQVRGGAGDIALTAQTLPDALGALCNKVFAPG